jgi:7-carboxy-7-deazaguanine synthase
MNKIKVSEIFYSIQGEGRYMGVPSVFLRTYGCNFQCQGFGMPKGELSQEVEPIAYDHTNYAPYTSYENLPLVSTGCDSYASWHPAFKNLSPFYEIDDLVEKIVNLLPNKEWQGEHLVITGGEPLLGWQKAYPSLLSHPKMKGLKDITFETNGTQPLTQEFRRFLYSWIVEHAAFNDRDITFSVSAKLSCSGEPRNKAIRPEVVNEYESVGFTYLKFVVATEEDAEEAIETVDIYRAEGFSGPVYLMPVGGINEVYNLNNQNVAEFALKNGLRYSDRLHLPLFGNKWGT